MDSGATQNITGTFTLNGTAADNIFLTSSVDGSAWDINPSGVRAVDYVTAKDVANIDPVPILAYHFTSLGNTPGWNGYVPPAPSGGPFIPGQNVIYINPFSQQDLQELYSNSPYITFVPVAVGEMVMVARAKM